MASQEENYFITEEHLPKILGAGTTRYRWISLACILIYFFIFFPAGIYGSICFFHKLAFADFHVPDTAILRQSGASEVYPWPIFWGQPENIMIQSNPPGQSLMEPIRWAEMAYFSLQMLELYKQYQDIGVIVGIRGYWIPGYRSDELIAGSNNDTTVISVNYDRGHVKPFIPDFEKWLATQEVQTSGRYTIKRSGIVELKSSLKHTVLSNMGLIDAISIPLGLFLFCIAGRSLPAVILPIAVILCSITTGLGLSQLLKMSMRITGFAPELMGVIVIALSIDFSLFFVNRLRELHAHQQLLQLQRSHYIQIGSLGEYSCPYEDGPSILETQTTYHPAVVWIAYKKVAHNIFISALAIALAFGGLATINADFVRSIALVCMFGVLMTLCSTMVFIPTIGYFLYPFCFDNRLQICIGNVWTSICARLCKCCTRKRDEGGGSDDTLQTAFTKEEADERQRLHSPAKLQSLKLNTDQHESQLHRFLAEFAFRRPIVVLLCAVALLAPFIYILLVGFSYNQSFLSSSPYNTDIWKNYVKIQEVFGNKVDAPLYLTVNAFNNDSEAAEGRWPHVMDQDFWPVYIHAVQLSLGEAALGLSLADIDAVCVFNNRLISWEESVQLRSCATLVAPADCLAYQKQLTFLTTNGDRSESSQYGNDPSWAKQTVLALRPTRGGTYGRNGAKYLDALHRIMESTRASQEYASLGNRIWIGYKGPNDWSWWVMNQVMRQFQIVLAITFSVLFGAILLLFRSLFFAVKMVLTVAYSVTLAFGIVTLCFHYSWLHNAWYPLKEIDAYFWLIVVLGFTVSCVVALDYDVFLIIRILDFRVVYKLNDKDSTIEALARSSSTIAWAAIIMVSAIGALIFANTVMLAQFGLTIALSVFVDAYLVRPLIVPAMIALMPSKALWFPRCFPTEEHA